MGKMGKRLRELYILLTNLSLAALVYGYRQTMKSKLSHDNHIDSAQEIYKDAVGARPGSGQKEGDGDKSISLPSSAMNAELRKYISKIAGVSEKQTEDAFLQAWLDGDLNIKVDEFVEHLRSIHPS